MSGGDYLLEVIITTTAHQDSCSVVLEEALSLHTE